MCVFRFQESKNEYSHLEEKRDDAPSNEIQLAEDEDDIYGDLGDLEGNDLMQFAYQIATGMVGKKKL